ncbi:MAG TPA: type I restriction endonuclease [Rhizomicrobium sp.]|jgi:type I restriction enzyme R subunit
MPKTDTSERALEALIVAELTGARGGTAPDGTGDDTWGYRGLYNYILGNPEDYDRNWTVDLAQLGAFVAATQPQLVRALDLDHDSAARQKFLARLQGETAKRGVIDVLRKGIRHGAHDVTLFYGSPSPENLYAQQRFAANRFSVTRQLRYSREETMNALDLAIFINGLPVFTFELKNNITMQTVEDAVEQYRRTRDPREKLFEFGRCVAHFAVDDADIRFCTELKGKASWFLPFNKGWKDGAGNPPNPGGIKTDYLWKQILLPLGLTDILENYAQIVEEKNPRTGRKKRVQIFPRYHQLDVVRKLLADVRENGAGHRYLVQHSAGSGKSNSIAWLAHQLIEARKDGNAVFDTVVVVTDRRILDDQIHQTIRNFAQVGATVGHADRSGTLRGFIEGGKKIVITTVQKFPFILDEIGSAHRDRYFAIVIDEAHSSQGGRTAAALNAALAGAPDAGEDEETVEDTINRLMEARKMLPNASYFAFTATPKPKTLQLFGIAVPTDGRKPYRPFHSYTMKQAIQEKFILDVLASFTPIESFYRLVKTVEHDPEFDEQRARKKLRRYVEAHGHAVRKKAEIMVDHFHDCVAAPRKIGGEARAMVVTGSVQRAIEYFHAFRHVLAEHKSPYRAIVAFSGEPEYDGEKVTEASLNGFPARDIANRFEEDPYRFLICADKFQTGYDQPLLHTMYVDKPLSGIKAVQTLSRLNRAHPAKYDVFVLDFQNDVDTIRDAFEDYYRTTVLSDETDPNRLHDLKADLDRAEVYSQLQVDEIVEKYLRGAARDALDPVLDACVAAYRERLDEDGQVDFKSRAKAFCRSYDFLAAVLPFSQAEWEKLSIFLNLLIGKLPAPKEDDLSKGILETVDMDSYRAEKQAVQRIQLADAEGEIEPIPVEAGGHRPEPQIERLSRIIESFNDLFGAEHWEDADRIKRFIAEDLPAGLSADTAYRNARTNSDRQNARIEHDRSLERLVVGAAKDHSGLYKKFMDDPHFRRWLSDRMFDLTYEAKA